MEQKDPQKILESLDSWEPIKASPYFSTRLMARWEREQEAASRPLWQLWWKPALLLAVTAINLFLIFGSPFPSHTGTSQDQGLKALMQEYQLQKSQSDDINLYNL